MRKLPILFVLALSVVLAVPAAAQDTGQLTIDAVIVAPELFQRAVNAFQAEEYDQAVLHSSMVILLNPTYSRAYWLRALSYMSLEQADDALEDLAVAIEHAPDADMEAILRLTRADIYVQRENWDLALADVSSAIEVAPESPDGYFVRAGIYEMQERYDDALADYNEAITLQPDFMDAYLGRARLHRELENFDEALSDYTRLVEANPQNAPLYLERGAVYHDAGSNSEAGADFLQWVRSISLTINQDHQLVIGQSIELELEEGLVYVIPFQATEGQVINIEATTAPNGEVDPLLVLVTAEDGEPLAGDDDSGGEFNAAILGYTIPSDAVYAVILTYSGGGSDGPVVLKLAATGS
jgi:tetratricopeptide (TPR) repeat protein